MRFSINIINDKYIYILTIVYENFIVVEYLPKARTIPFFNNFPYSLTYEIFCCGFKALLNCR